MCGTLYIVATPIGNLGDFSPRAKEVLEKVDFIAAEDTRVGAKLLNAFSIKKPQISYFEHNRQQKSVYIAQRILAGENCALITDAGTPAISDPGCDLAQICASFGVPVVAVPGPCAMIAALSISGLPCGRFTFEGFLSTSPKNRREHLLQVKDELRTMVFYEAPHKLKRTLDDLYAALGERDIAICRELTKIYEEVLRLKLSEACRYYEENMPRGEFVLVISGAVKAPVNEEEQLNQAMGKALDLMNQGASAKDAAKQASGACNVSKNALYQQLISVNEKKK